MNNFRVPPSPAWYTQPVCSPDDGLLYIAGNHTSIAYIRPVGTDDATDDEPNIQIIQTFNQFKAIDCDPNWTTTKWFVTMNEQNYIWVWNLETEKICRGHKAHVINANDRQIDSDAQLGGAMCITKNRQVLSIDRNTFVRYCLASNTYSKFPDNFVTKRGTVSLLKASPYNQDIIGIGYKNGLIVIANYAETSELQKLRGHDSEIVSLQWTLLKSTSPNDEAEAKAITPPGDGPEAIEKTPSTFRVQKEITPNETSSTSKPKLEKTADKKPAHREPPKPIVDADDMFDIHSYDYLEKEFGTMTSHPNRSVQLKKEPTESDDHKTNNENFDFAEECQTLRDKIRSGNQSDSDDSNYNGANQSAVNMSDIRNMIARNPVKDDSIILSDDSDEPPDEFSNRSTIGSSHNTTEIAELEDVIKDLNIIEDGVKETDGIVYLASGAQESFVVIWDAQTGTVMDKIHMKQGRSKIPKTNCTIVWIRPNVFVVNGPDGRVSKWKSQNETSSDNMKFTLVAEDYPDTAVINICSNAEYNLSTPIVWTFSTHLNIIGHQFTDESSEIVSKYATLPIGMFALRECPHDPNMIAIAGNNKRISILDLSTLKRSNVEIQSLTSKVQGKVIALAWHPTNENLLSFSTNEGRVGIFNITKTSSPPDLIKNFNGKDLYGLTYGVFTDTNKCILYATNGEKLMIFDESSTKSDDHKSLKFSSPVSSIGLNDKYIAIGLANGTLKILLNDSTRKEIFSESLSKKYLSELSWSTLNPSKLAVSSSDNNIFIVDELENVFQKTGQLTGHAAGLTCVRWSGQSEYKLVSASFDHTVRVWDTQSMECIAWSEFENKMHCAAFLPTDENFVVCSGLSETLNVFEIEKRLIANVGQFDNKKKKKKAFNSEVQWGTQYQNEATKLRTQEKRKLRKLAKKPSENVDEIVNGLSAVKLTTTAVKLNHTTILYLTSKELNKEPLTYLQRLLQESETSTQQNDDQILHSKLFGNRDDVVQLLNEELKNHRGSKTDSIGNILIPQINFDLKTNIIQSIEEKSLTEQQVSLAPSISYEFWKNCSLAYANQCIDQGFVLVAIPHLLAVQQMNEAIEKLCDAHFYREAWCIAKTSKEPEDKIFETIATKWIKYLEQMGNLEAAALISFLAGKREMSFEMLNKRKFKTPQIEDILNALSSANKTQ